ncbi:MAG: hypothetical protein APF77_14620 [Clostridia bacterium BRH_c25]|nr:MAG: hypothetical protein APF77_14620 [Clostridia bacterium BRH_c25]
MKRITALVTIVTVLSLMLTAFVFADDTTDVPQWFRDMISWKKAQIEQAEQAGSITKEQAELYKSNIDQMEKFHLGDGFTNATGFGVCGGIRGGANTGYGFGRGMMGTGYGYNMMNGFNSVQ